VLTSNKRGLESQSGEGLGGKGYGGIRQSTPLLRPLVTTGRSTAPSDQLQ